MPYRTLCSFKPVDTTVTLRLPNKKWKSDTVICDTEGNEWFVLQETDKGMRSYEGIFGDLDGHKMICVRRKMIRAVWTDGFYFCTYKPNWTDQPALFERDVNNRRIYPFSFMEIAPQKGRFAYKLYTFEDGQMELERRPMLVSDNGFMGVMTIWCTPMTRCFRWNCTFRRPNKRETKVGVDQWKNTVEIQPGQDILASLAMAYVFDVCQRQPFVTLAGKQDPEFEDEDMSDDSDDEWDDEEDDFDLKKDLKKKKKTVDDEYSDDELSEEEEEARPLSKRKKPRSRYAPAEPDEEAFADCLDD